MNIDRGAGDLSFCPSKIWCVRKWHSLPRFVKIYNIFFFVFAMLFICFVAFSSTIFFTSFAANSESEVESAFNGQLIEEARQQSTNSIPSSDFDWRKRIEEAIRRKKIFNFHDDGDYEISYQEDLLDATHTPKQIQVVEAMRHSWSAYRDYAWGSDHLRPVTKGRQNWFNVGLTIIDSIDTLLFMGMEAEFQEALAWVEDQLNFDIDKDVNCFEMTIRVLGGLESSYHLTKEPAFLAKAADIGDRLIHCFDSPSNLVPFSDVNLLTRVPKAPAWSPESSLSEVATVQLEFRDLSRLVDDSKYEDISFKTSQHIHSIAQREGNLLPMYINPHTGHFTPSTITLGARGDSYYEYLLKQFLQTGIDWLQEDYINFVAALKARLIKTTKGPKKLTYVAEILRNSTAYSPKMDHLVCFLPGTLALGYYHAMKYESRFPTQENCTDGGTDTINWSECFYDHLQLAEDLARTCWEMYRMTATGLAPEIVHFGLNQGDEEIYVRPADTHNLLRPEYVESLFYLYHVTGNQMYREQGSKIMDSFNKYSKVHLGGFTVMDDPRNPHNCRPRSLKAKFAQILKTFSKVSNVPSGGYTSLGNVCNPYNTRPKNMQESFWLAETLKYLFLLFSDDKQLISKILNNYVFNTEAHLIPIIKDWN